MRIGDRLVSFELVRIPGLGGIDGEVEVVGRFETVVLREARVCLARPRDGRFYGRFHGRFYGRFRNDIRDRAQRIAPIMAIFARFRIEDRRVPSPKMGLV